MAKTKILTSKEIDQKLNRMAFQVYENFFSEKQLLIVGIDGNGYKVAKEIYARLNKISDLKLTLGKLTINKNEPWDNQIKSDFTKSDFENKNVLVVDDVLNSGKTLVYAIRSFLDYPVKRLNTLILVDRQHTRFPVKADFVGLSLNTTLQEHIEADFSKKGSEAVYLK